MGPVLAAGPAFFVIGREDPVGRSLDNLLGDHHDVPATANKAALHVGKVGHGIALADDGARLGMGALIAFAYAFL